MLHTFKEKCGVFSKSKYWRRVWLIVRQNYFFKFLKESVVDLPDKNRGLWSEYTKIVAEWGFFYYWQWIFEFKSVLLQNLPAVSLTNETGLLCLQWIANSIIVLNVDNSGTKKIVTFTYLFCLVCLSYLFSHHISFHLSCFIPRCTQTQGLQSSLCVLLKMLNTCYSASYVNIENQQ